MTKPTKPFALVIWNDAHATLEELTEDEIRKEHKPSTCHSRGWVVISDAVGIYLAAEWLAGDPETWRGLMFIPRGMVVSETLMSLSRPRRKRTMKRDGTDSDRDMPALRSSGDRVTPLRSDGAA